MKEITVKIKCRDEYESEVLALMEKAGAFEMVVMEERGELHTIMLTKEYRYFNQEIADLIEKMTPEERTQTLIVAKISAKKREIQELENQLIK